MKQAKEKPPVMPMKEFGMSEYFMKLSGGEPFFILQGTELLQNMKCRTTGPDFIKHYNKFLSGR